MLYISAPTQGGQMFDTKKQLQGRLPLFMLPCCPNLDGICVKTAYVTFDLKHIQWENTCS